MSRVYLAVVKEVDGKYYAFAETIKDGENLVPFIEKWKCNVAHVCKTRKEAEDLAVEWNKRYKENGTNMF